MNMRGMYLKDFFTEQELLLKRKEKFRSGKNETALSTDS